VSGIDWVPSNASDWEFVGSLAVIIAGIAVLIALLCWLGTQWGEREWEKWQNRR
jgi:hypothetical protein